MATMTITDELAEIVAKLAEICAGFHTETWEIWAQEANAVLAKYRQEQAAAPVMDWVRDIYPDQWIDWLESGSGFFQTWLQAKYPSVWSEYVEENEP